MWVYGGIRIFVQEIGENGKQNIARLQPVVGGTVKQVFGYEDLIYRVNGVVVGDTDKDALLAMRTTGVPYTLSGYGTDYGELLMNTCSTSRVQCIGQTLRSDLACDAPVYTVELELYE